MGSPPPPPRGEVAIIGLARSGRSAARLLAGAGSAVYASDVTDSPDLQAGAVELRQNGIVTDVGRHDLGRIARAALVVVSPGVRPQAPPVVAARNAGVEIVSEIEIGLRFLPDLRYIAITGTNGKTTTTALAAHLLQALGHRAVAAGNIGVPLTELALAAERPTWVALEVSSFQLHDTPNIAPAVGVLTNLSANHLDRYASVDEYFADKRRLFRNAGASSRWVTNADDSAVQTMIRDVQGSHRFFSLAKPTDAYFERQVGEMRVLHQTIINRREFPLLGDHNVANALAATLAVMVADAAHVRDAAIERIRGGLRSFHGLEHRIEVVGEVNGVTWINDSKSTNVVSTMVALRGMSRPTVLLLGGRHKGEPYTGLAPELKRIGRAVVAYGEAAPLIAADLTDSVPVTRLESSFEEVIAVARRLAKPGDAVLLSPACSSFDMFANYEERGRVFKQLVRDGRTSV